MKRPTRARLQDVQYRSKFVELRIKFITDNNIVIGSAHKKVRLQGGPIFF